MIAPADVEVHVLAGVDAANGWNALVVLPGHDHGVLAIACV